MKIIKDLKDDLIFSRFANRNLLNNYKFFLNTKISIILLLEKKFKKSWHEILKTNYNIIDK